MAISILSRTVDFTPPVRKSSNSFLSILGGSGNHLVAPVVGSLTLSNDTQVSAHLNLEDVVLFPVEKAALYRMGLLGDLALCQLIESLYRGYVPSGSAPNWSQFIDTLSNIVWHKKAGFCADLLEESIKEGLEITRVFVRALHFDQRVDSLAGYGSTRVDLLKSWNSLQDRLDSFSKREDALSKVSGLNNPYSYASRWRPESLIK